MIEPKINQENGEIFTKATSLSFHTSFYHVFEKLQKWMARFPQAIDNSIMNDLVFFFLATGKKYLDHRNHSHLFRLVLSIYNMQKKLIHSATFFPHQRHLEIRWIPTSLTFPFSSKPVLGCIIGFNVLDKYELFEEENILLALHKFVPGLKLVRESSYCHPTVHKNLKIYYFEIEKAQSALFSLEQLQLLKINTKEKIKNCIQKLSPAVYMGHNEEETYKNILVLSQEIHSPKDLPQAYITLDHQTGTEIIFRIILVHIKPFHRFSLKNYFGNCKFISHRVVTIKHVDNHSIEANIFSIHLPRNVSLLRSDGSLDFYSARQKVTALIIASIGEFRDFNGGIIITQQKLLQNFKESFPHNVQQDAELFESFFYSITPLEKQAILNQNILNTLFSCFLESRTEKAPNKNEYILKIYHNNKLTYITVRSDLSSMVDTINTVLQEQEQKIQDIAYNFISAEEGYFFNCVFLTENDKNDKVFISALSQALDHLHQKMKDKQVLRIAFGYGQTFSLDPRIGGDALSGNILRFVFEGLTRVNQNGEVENALAESIEISPNMRQYVFKLRPSFWNDGSPVTAYDFEYAWKKILSPDFKTSFAYFFYPITNAKETKEGKISSEQVGIQVIDDHKLMVELIRPAPYFLQFLSHPLFSPIHRFVDQKHPEWPYQIGKSYLCNGPFQLEINQPNQGYQLTKNPYYWETSHVKLDQIYLTEMTPLQAFQAFQKQEIDWIGNPFGPWHASYNQQSDNKMSLFSKSILWSVFNTSYEPLNHCKIRQAFAYAINRSKMITEELQMTNLAYSLLLSTHNAQPQFPDYDLNHAQKLLSEALKELNLNKKKLASLKLTFINQENQLYIAKCLRQQFKECLDIDLIFEPLPWNEVFRKMTQGDFQMGLMNWWSTVDDPIYTLNTFKYAREGINFAKWENADFQQFIDLSLQELNPFQRSFYLTKAEEILIREMPAIPLFYPSRDALVTKQLNGNLEASLNFTRSFLKKQI